MRWRIVAEGCGLGLWDWDLETDRVVYSGRWKSMLGDREPASGLAIAEWKSLVHPEDLPAVRLMLERHFSGETPFYEVEHRVRGWDGRYTWVLDQGRLIERRPDGSPKRMIGVDMDITERKLAETELRIAASVFESQEGVIVTDAHEVILRVNQAFTRMTGYASEDVVGKTPRLLKSGRHGPDFYAAMWASIQDSGSWKGEIWNRRKSGEIYPEWLGITAIRGDGDGVTHYVATLHDITERKAAEQAIQHLAFYDALTGLPNRRLLLDRLSHGQIVSERSGHCGALLFIDLDRFKDLNDSLGHMVGDLLLQQVARRLSRVVRDVDTVARLGGDEFVIMLEDLSEDEREARRQAEDVGAKILGALSAPYQLAEHQHRSTPSIGVVLFRGPDPTSEDLIARADLAMYRAKQSGRNNLCFFEREMQVSVDDRSALRDELRRGIGRKQFTLHYQPQVDRDGRIRGAEALLRWANPLRAGVLPNEFIPLAEESGLILPLGYWVLREACSQLEAWSGDPDTRRLTLSVNISARQFRDPNFIKELRDILRQSGADPRRLRLEVNEGLLRREPAFVSERLAELKAIGLGLSLDNFGTGYSSLTKLRDLPFDQLKLGQPLVCDLPLDLGMTAIAASLIDVGHALGLEVLASGVETEAQRSFLHAHACDAFQGYLFDRPLARQELTERLRPSS
nr:bifunctional diguanylate cyclase/phosphodiesterase [Thiocystis violacea]